MQIRDDRPQLSPIFGGLHQAVRPIRGNQRLKVQSLKDGTRHLTHGSLIIHEQDHFAPPAKFHSRFGH